MFVAVKILPRRLEVFNKIIYATSPSGDIAENLDPYEKKYKTTYSLTLSFYLFNEKNIPAFGKQSR
jgi:hypothetical protein